MGWNSWDSNWQVYGNGKDYSNFIFIQNPEDMKKDIDIKDVGKEIFFLTKHAFCETCDKTLKAYASEAKAQAQVEKHLGYKKYAGHNAFVKTVNFTEFNKCTTADIIGTKANRERNQQIKDAHYGVVKKQIQRIIDENQETFERIEAHCGFTHRHEHVPDEPISVKDGSVSFSNEKLHGELTLDKLDRIKELLDGNYKHPNPEVSHKHLSPFERSSTIWYYMHIGRNRFNEVYHWDYPVSYDPFVIDESEEIPDCIFCKKPIKKWNDLIEDIHYERGFIHRGCLQHAQEALALRSYAEKEAKKTQEVVTS